MTYPAISIRDQDGELMDGLPPRDDLQTLSTRFERHESWLIKLTDHLEP